MVRFSVFSHKVTLLAASAKTRIVLSSKLELTPANTSLAFTVVIDAIVSTALKEADSSVPSTGITFSCPECVIISVLSLYLNK